MYETETQASLKTFKFNKLYNLRDVYLGPPSQQKKPPNLSDIVGFLIDPEGIHREALKQCLQSLLSVLRPSLKCRLLSYPSQPDGPASAGLQIP